MSEQAEPKMLVVGSSTMICSRCGFHYIGRVEDDQLIVRHMAPEDYSDDFEQMKMYLSECPLSGKRFTFPVATELVGTEMQS